RTFPTTAVMHQAHELQCQPLKTPRRGRNVHVHLDTGMNSRHYPFWAKVRRARKNQKTFRTDNLKIILSKLKPLENYWLNPDILAVNQASVAALAHQVFLRGQSTVFGSRCHF